MTYVPKPRIKRKEEVLCLICSKNIESEEIRCECGMSYHLSCIIPKSNCLVCNKVLKKRKPVVIEEKGIFAVEDMFVIHKDGSYVAHYPESSELDEEQFRNLLFAIKKFMRKFGMGDIKKVRYGSSNIFVERGPIFYIALVTSGEAPKDFRRKVRESITIFHVENKELLKKGWKYDRAIDFEKLWKEIKGYAELEIPEKKYPTLLVDEEFFKIENIFLIYHNGLLIAQYSATEDAISVSAMFIAIQSFIKESLKKKIPCATEMEHGKFKVLIERGANVYLAVVISGKEREDIREKMRALLIDIQKKFGTSLKKWKGNLKDLEGIDILLKNLVGE